VRFLIRRRRQPVRAIFVAAAVLLLLTGATGVEYGALYLYVPLALACLVHAIYPTLVSWVLATTIYLSFSAIYLYGTVRDLIEIARGRQPEMFQYPGDNVVVAGLVIALLALTISFLCFRPRPLDT